MDQQDEKPGCPVCGSKQQPREKGREWQTPKYRLECTVCSSGPPILEPYLLEEGKISK